MSGLVMPPPAARAARSARERTPLPPGTSTLTGWIWVVVITPWVTGSTIFLFDLQAIFRALWVGDADTATGHALTHTALMAGGSALAVAIVLVAAWRDATALRSRGVAHPFPWGFAAIGAFVYLVGRHLVLRRVSKANPAPLISGLAIMVLWYAGFVSWAILTVAAALTALQGYSY